ncbi:MAG: hypothetical protein QXH61_03365 [Candidatus Nezhaarchaeales archaeon]
MPNGIIADKEVLEGDYIPESIPCREPQKKNWHFAYLQLRREGSLSTAYVMENLEQVRRP